MKQKKKGSRYGKSDLNTRRNFKQRDPNRTVAESTGRSANTGKFANDPAWHVLNPELLRDLGKFNTNMASGLPIVPDRHYRTCVPTPGIATLHCLLTGGTGTALGDDPLAEAAKALYTEVRHANSGGSNYVAPDLFMYILAVGQCIAYYTHLCRLYGAGRTFSQRSVYKPEYLVQALGFDYNKFVDNLSNFKMALDEIPTLLNQRMIPNKLDLIRYYVLRMSTLYLDDPDTDKAQIYAYVPNFFYVYQGYTDRRGGKLVPSSATSYMGQELWELRDPMDCVRELRRMINTLITDEDTGIMMGDLLKTYGSEGMFKVNPVPNDFTVIPVYDEIELWTIHNTRFLGQLGPSGVPWGAVQENFKIYQDPTGSSTEGGSILFNPVFWKGDTLETVQGNQIISLKKDPTAEELVEIFRNVPVLTGCDGKDSTVYNFWKMHYSFGSVSVTHCTVHYFYLEEDGTIDKSAVDYWSNYVGTGSTSANLTGLSPSRSFNLFPVMFFANNDLGAVRTEASTLEDQQSMIYDHEMWPIFDLAQYGVADANYLLTYIRTSVLSELNVMA